MKYSFPGLTYDMVEIDNEQIFYLMKDNQAKKTLLFIHGFTASYHFIDPILLLKNNYNIVSINLPMNEVSKTSREITVDFLYNLVKKFIALKLSKTDLILVGHSFSGTYVTKLAKLPIVKQVIFLATIHPQLLKSSNYLFMKLIFDKQPKKIQDLRPYLGFWTTLWLQLSTKHRANFEWAQMIADPNSLYYPILKNVIFNQEYMTKELLADYQAALKKPCHFVISQKDELIESKYFKMFVEEDLKQNLLIFERGLHQLVQTNPEQMNQWINQLVMK